MSAGKLYEGLGRWALKLGWPYSLHDERLKRAGREIKNKDPDESGYWDWWPDLKDELTELACIPWVEKAWEGRGDALVCRAKGAVFVYGPNRELIWGVQRPILASALLEAMEVARPASDYEMSSEDIERRLVAMREHFGSSDEEFVKKWTDESLTGEPDYVEWLVLLGRSDLV